MLCEASKQPMAHICRSAWPYMFEPVFRWSSARCFLFIIAVCSAIRAAPSTYEGCPDVPPGWSPDCPLAAHARVRRGNNIFYWTPYTSTRWGNALSPYWQARAVAELAGYGFNAYGGFSHGWLKHLPKDVPPQGCPNITIFNQACSSKYCEWSCRDDSPCSASVLDQTLIAIACSNSNPICACTCCPTSRWHPHLLHAYLDATEAQCSMFYRCAPPITYQ